MDTDTKIEKRKWPAALAGTIGNTLVLMLRTYCEHAIRPDEEPPVYCTVAGSLRRGRAEVGDVEILYVPKFGDIQKPGEMFGSTGSLADNFINGLVGTKLEKRKNVDGHVCWGEKNKLAVHKATGMPVDFFATTKQNWWVSLVIRTGPKDFNIRLIESARKQGLQLHAYGSFTVLADGHHLGPIGSDIFPQSEREVFELAGMEWMEPEERF